MRRRSLIAKNPLANEERQHRPARHGGNERRIVPSRRSRLNHRIVVMQSAYEAKAQAPGLKLTGSTRAM